MNRNISDAERPGDKTTGAPFGAVPGKGRLDADVERAMASVIDEALATRPYRASNWWHHRVISALAGTSLPVPSRGVFQRRFSAERQKRRASKPRPTGSVKKRIMKSKYDQFYTRPEEANRLFLFAQENVDLSKSLMVEPSAGEGAFFRLMPAGSLGYDRKPGFPGIVKKNFLKVTLPRGRPIAVLGNPPFGRNANTAVEHFNRAAGQPDVQVIAMIFPKSFRKAAIENRLDCNFHLLRETEVARDAFCFDGKAFAVNTVFQIWVRRTTARALRVVETEHPDFRFTKPNVAHFVIQRVGVRAGRIHHNRKASPDSHYFIRSSAWLFRGSVQGTMERLDFASAAANATANPSLAKSEIVAIYREHLRELSTLLDLDIEALPQPRQHHGRSQHCRDGHRRRNAAPQSSRVRTQAEAQRGQ